MNPIRLLVFAITTIIIKVGDYYDRIKDNNYITMDYDRKLRIER